MRICPSCGASYDDTVSFCGVDGKITIEQQDPADHDPRLGKLLGEYIIAARVADGGMGRVYEGRHPETKARVAVKVLHDNIALDTVAVERFKREFETAGEVDHGNVVKVLDFGQTDDASYFLTMEYLDGLELSQELESIGTFSPARILRIMGQLAEGLDHAHSFGVIHRDLKPDNIFLCRSDEGDVVKLLDFGSVKLQMETGQKLTAIGTTLGSPYYMSPEQAMGKLDVDQRTDVFAVAAIAWEMATGKIAFEGGSVAEILTKIVGEDPPSALALNDALPPQFDATINRGVAKDKTLRPGSVSGFVESLFAAFGLDAKAHKGASEAELESALMTATPPSATPSPSSVAASVTASVAASPNPAPTTPNADLAMDAGLPSSGKSKGPLWIAVAGVVLLAAAAAVFFLK